MVADFHVARALVVGLESVGNIAEVPGVVIQNDRTKYEVVLTVPDVIEPEGLDTQEFRGAFEVPRTWAVDLHEAFCFMGAHRFATTGLYGRDGHEEGGGLTGKPRRLLEVPLVLEAGSHLLVGVTSVFDAHLSLDPFLQVWLLGLDLGELRVQEAIRNRSHEPLLAHEDDPGDGEDHGGSRHQRSESLEHLALQSVRLNEHLTQ